MPAERGPVGRLIREPLVHFLGVAALLFVANHVFRGDQREVIVVDAATREYLVQRRQELVLRPLTEDEKTQAVEDFIEEEILVREGRKRGFENSSRIRGLLIQNMRFFLASEVPDPDDAELRAFFDQNTERFETPPAVTYEHVLFSDPDSVPGGTLEALRSGADYRQLGDSSPLVAKLPRAGERQIVSSFGREQGAAILAIDDGHWHGPFTSPSGAHFLRVSERHPGAKARYESALDWLEQEWRMAKRREIIEQEMESMRRGYRIEVEEPATGGE